jgi:hypothetical protein
MPSAVLDLLEADPFDLPEWLGVEQVVWSAESGLRTGHRVTGLLSSPQTGEQLACDLLAADVAYPRPVVGNGPRLEVHRAWHDGQVYVGTVSERLTLVVPGTAVSAELALDALERLARAVGGDPERYAVLLRIGGGARSQRR